MNILFINPSVLGSPIPNPGLAYVMSSTEQDHRIKLLDFSFHRKNYPEYLCAGIEAFQPDVVGFSVTSFSFDFALTLASLVRRRFPGTPLVYGGVQATLLPEETLQSPLVDAVCIGEGEDSFREYLSSVAAGREPRDVAGIWYKDKTGRVVRNALRPFREDLDSIPFPNWDHWEIERYLKTNNTFPGGLLRLVTSRGCPYSCAFCSSPAIRKAIPGKFWRTRSPENVIQEIEQDLEKYGSKGFRHVFFDDDILGLDLDSMERLCALYVERGLSRHLSWSCQIRIDTVSERWCKAASRSGCVLACLGIESGDEGIRRGSYRKDFSNAQIEEAMAMLEKYRILAGIYMIIGCPEDSRETIERSVRFIRRLKPAMVMFNLYHPLPKTELAESVRGDSRFSTDYSDIFRKSYHRGVEVPYGGTKYLTAAEVRSIAFRIKVRKAFDFLFLGVRLGGIVFAWDILRYLAFLIRSRRPIFHIYSFTELENNTTIRYLRMRYDRASALPQQRQDPVPPAAIAGGRL